MTILYPAFLMFALTTFCQFRLGSLRFAAVKRGEVDPHYYRLFQNGSEPAAARAYSRHLANLFEAPVLFYTIVIIAFVTHETGLLPVVLAWIYALLRYLHSFIHLGSNKVLLRFRVFALSWLVLIVLWIFVFAGLVFKQAG